MTILIDKSSSSDKLLNANEKQAVIPEDYAPHPTSETWSREAVDALFALPFIDLILKAQTIHRQNHAQCCANVSASFHKDRRLRRRLWVL